jgi:cytochrome c-type biogenesis protein CcmF
VVGVAGSSAYATVQERTLRTGQHARVAGDPVQLVAVGRRRDADAMSTSATLLVTRHGGEAVTVRPALRFFPAQAMTVASPAVVSGVSGDLYVTLLSVSGSRVATLRVAHNPLVGWIWAGGAVMVLGGLWAMWPRRRRRPARIEPAERPEREPSRERLATGEPQKPRERVPT